MFSPDAYWRLVARYNEAWWPGQAVGMAAALALLACLRSASSQATHLALLLLAAAWAFTGWAFQWQRYAEIFLGSAWLALASGVQAGLLLAAAVLPRDGVEPPGSPARAAGAGLILAALLFPLLSFMEGRGWHEAEVPGFMPDPTALATLGVVLALAGLRGWERLLLATVPALTLLLGAATRWLIA